MEKPIACLDIGTTSIKLVIANVQEQRVDVLYAACKSLKPGVIENGHIVDIDFLIETIIDMKTVLLPSSKSRINLEDVVVIVPSIGLEVYQNNKSTNVISETGKIEKIDVSNAYSLIRKDKVTPNSEIVDIIPDYFALENGQMFDVAPIGQISDSLIIKAKVHTLPRKILDGYRRVINAAGLRALRFITKAFAISNLVQNDELSPKTYFLVDIGYDVTTISLISNGALFSSLHLDLGVRDLNQKIASKFGIPSEDAEQIRMMYGIDNSVGELNIPIFRGRDEALDQTNQYYNHDLNACIIEYLDEFSGNVLRSIRAIAQEQGLSNFENMPVLLSGSVTNLNGLSAYLLEKYHNRVRIIQTKTIGARSSKYVASLGALLSIKKNQQEIIEDSHRVTNLSRVNSENNKEHSEVDNNG